ncbi:UNVERIFIED_CONTAM: hypothetical protein RMT77_002311 [Armadillidium vulgare]
MKFRFLGTGASYPTPHRGVSSLGVQFSNGSIWLFDCGEGTQIQLQKVHFNRKRISKIFITHLHGDHLFGLPGLLCTLSSQSYPTEEESDDKNVSFHTVDIYGPLGLRKFLYTTLSLSRSPLSIKYRVHELEPAIVQYPGDWKDWDVDHNAPTILHPSEFIGRVIKPSLDEGGNASWKIFDEEEYSVEAGVILHRIPCFGYVIREKDKQGPLLTQKLKAFGVEPGPLYGKLKRGENVNLENGEVILAKDVVGACVKGRTVVICGDTHDAFPLKHLIRDCDVLVHEATHDDSLKEKAIETGHSTPTMAAEFCKSINGKILILNHISQRYKNIEENDNRAESIAVILEQAKSALEGTDVKVVCAYDLFEFDFTRKKRAEET